VMNKSTFGTSRLSQSFDAKSFGRRLTGGASS
jgi:hypothetical protein